MLRPSTKVRSRRGCLTCRLRKVKCDEHDGRCQNCIRLNLECSWPVISSFQNRKKFRKACERCRLKKLKCGMTDGVQQCDNCTLARVECIKCDPVEPLQSSPPLVRQTSPNKSTDLPSRPEIVRILQAYFNGPHHFCLYTFIHPPTFMQMLDNDLIPKGLLLIVLATGLRCIDPDSVLPDRWAEECRHLVIPDIFSRASTTNLQTLLLLKQYEWHRGAHLSAWFVAALATRLATALQLEMEPSSTRAHAPPLPITVMETRRRLIWSCFTMDSVPDGSTRPLRSALDPFSIEARLPCNERSYWLGIETQTDTLHNSKSHGSFFPKEDLGPPSILAYTIRMAVIRLQVLQYASSFSSRNKDLLLPEIPWQLNSQFHLYKRQLDEFMNTLPPELQLDYDEEPGVTVPKPRNNNNLCTLHVMYHASYTDLLRVALFLEKAKIVVHNESLPGFQRQSVPNFHQSAEFKSFLQSCRCSRLQHAYTITTIVAKFLPSSHDLDPFVSVCTCVSIRVFVLEREPGDAESLGMSEPTIQKALDVATTCARKTARWSKPVREMLHALVRRCLQYGYRLDVPEVSLPGTLSPTSRPPSRAQSPSLRTYGTQGSIHRSLARQRDDTHISPNHQSKASTTDATLIDPGRAHDSHNTMSVPESVPQSSQMGPAVPTEPFLPLESNVANLNTPAPAPAPPSVPESNSPGKTIDLDGLFLHSYEALSPESLRITSNWGDGTYDLVSDDLSFAMGPGDTFLGLDGGDYQLFGSEIDNNSAWPTL